MFHVDFSYLFGQDPKPFPPPMKLCREIVEAMGGLTGAPFSTFKSLCFTAFSLARSRSSTILSTIGLSSSAIPDSDAAIAYVIERFVLDVSEHDALVMLESLIDESVHAMFPVVFETIHKWAQYWRK